MNKESKKSNLWKIWAIVIIAAIATGIVASGIFIYSKTKDKKTDHKNSVMQSDTESDLDEENESEENEENQKKDDNSKTVTVSSSDVSGIVESVMPAVVSVNCTVSAKDYYDGFDELFGFGYGDGYGKNYEIKSTGTGFIVAQNVNEILIVTNQHVVEDAKSVKVKLADGTEVEATIKGSDAEYDIAVLSVNGAELSDDTIAAIRIAAIGNSDNLSVGDMAIAIGNSLGYGQSVTVGYISALDRDVAFEDRNMQLIQTDAAINDGNSGGPLVNIYGEVIGITNAKKTRSYGEKVEGVCYAIPVSQVVPIINELMNRVELDPKDAGYLGIVGKEVSESYSKAFGMPQGVYVNSVDPDSPAEKAGIRKGDVIVSLNGRKVTNMDELKEILSFIKYDTEVEVGISTLGSAGYTERIIKVVLGKR